MTRAATQLRITQSAVSKRIAALERQVDQKLIEPAGRNVRLTPAGLRLLEKMRPLLASMREVLLEESAPRQGRIVIGVSESILSSWGAPLLAAVGAALTPVDLVVNAHRSPVAVDRVRSGEYMLALCAGVSDEAPDLQAEKLLEEPMVIVPSGLEPFRLSRRERLPVLTIEPGSATWVYLERRLKRARREWGFAIEIERTLQSFSCIVQLARHGMGHGLVPVGIAAALGVGSEEWIDLPPPGLTRPISLVGRRTTFALPLVRLFCQHLQEEAARLALSPSNLLI